MAAFSCAQTLEVSRINRLQCYIKFRTKISKRISDKPDIPYAIMIYGP